MHHRKGWISKRKEGLFRFKLHLNNGKYEKRFKTKWVPENMVAFILRQEVEKRKDEEHLRCLIKKAVK